MSGRPVVALTVLLLSAASAAQDLTITAANSPMVLTGTTSYGNVTVESGGTLVVDGTLSLAGNLLVRSGGTVTKTQGTPQLTIRTPTGAVTVEFNASIDVTGKGLLGGNQPGHANCSGQVHDPATLSIVAGAAKYRGGSHGGQGGNGGPGAYGTVATAQYRGGGGGCGDGVAKGGNGGGAIRIEAATVTVDGAIRADGARGTAGSSSWDQWGSGGAGGSIWLTVGTFDGIGNLSASGASSGPGGGAGGRISVTASTSYAFTGVVSSAAGSNAGVGSTWLKNAANSFWVTGGYLDLGSGQSVAAVNMGPGGLLRITGAPTITAPLDVAAGSTLELNSSTALQNLSLVSPVAGTVIVNAGVTQPTSLIVDGRLTVNATFTVTGNLTLSGTGTLDHAPQKPQSWVNVSGTLDVQGQINLTGKGLSQGLAIDPTFKAVVSGAGSYAGGSHGGAGGGNTNPVYGHQDSPGELGSGGGSGQGGSVGGSGGGRIRISAATLIVDGAIIADGSPSSTASSSWDTRGGGGSGGAVRIDVTSFQGAGVISARGGSSSNSGGGGGGRISVSYQSSTFSGSLVATGGTGATPGSSGSVRAQSAAGALRVQAGTYSLDGTHALSSVMLLPGASLRINGPAQLTAPLTVAGGSEVILGSTDALTSIQLNPTISGSLIVNAPFSLGTLTVPGRLEVNAHSTAGDLTVGGTLELNKVLTLTNFTAQSTATVTHEAGATEMEIAASGTVTFAGGSVVNLSGKGLAQGVTYDPATLTVTSGASSYTGGSHGGLGGYGASAAPAVYGDQDAPALLGGGGGGGQGGSTGGRGGGRFELSANVVDLDGNILADGANSSNASSSWDRRGGGGAGGAVHIQATTLRGGGLVTARGGAGGNGGGGGGGRIRLSYTTSTFAGQVSAAGGSGNGTGAPGTVRLTNTGTTSDLIVQAGEYHLKTGDSYNSVTLLTGAILHVDGSPSVMQPVSIPSGTTVWINNSSALQNLILPTTVGGTLVVNAPLTWTGPHVVSGRLWVRSPLTTGGLSLLSGAALEADQLLTIQGDLDAASGSTVTHTAGITTLDIRVANVFTVQAGAVVDANGRGHPGGNRGSFGCAGTATDPATKLAVSGAGKFGGGSFGGLGGGSANPVYGSASDVTYLGSGGGCGDGGSLGGNGGGLVRITSAVLNVSGAIRANGTDSTNASSSWDTRGGGASGGGVFLTATQLTGAGNILANGGNGGNGNGGGAGRIRIDVVTNDFTGTLQTNGGTGAAAGGTSTATVGTFNTPPTIVSTPAGFARSGSPWSYDGDGRPEAVGPGPLTWSLQSAPASATIDAATGAITWVPSGLSVASFTLVATNPHGTASQSFTVQVMAPPRVVSVGAAATQVNQPYHYNATDTLQATGSAPLTYTATLAPPGSPAFSVDATGKVTWTPTAPGNYSACIRVENAVGLDDHCFAVNVTSSVTSPTITSTPPTTAQLNQLYTYQVQATGTPPITFALFNGAAPAGAAIDAATGTLSWTPTETGQVTFCVEATGVGSAVQCWAVTVAGLPVAPQIVSTCSSLATVGEPYHYDQDDTAEAIGTAPITWSLLEAPAGMTVDANGTIAWTPAAVGGVAFSLQALNAAGSFTQPCQVTVRSGNQGGPAVILRNANLFASVGTAYKYDANGKIDVEGDQPITFSKVSGPANLFVDKNTGRVTWLPSSAGRVTVAVKASNAAGSDTYSFDVEVSGNPGGGPVAKFTAAPVSGDSPLTVAFDGGASSGPHPLLSLLWDFGDGSPAVEGPTVSHVYSACGGFVARLTVTDVYGQTSVEQAPISVACNGLKPPRAKIVISSTESNGRLDATIGCDCAPGGAPIIGYQWKATDGFFSDLASDTHSFGPGAHTLQLIVVDANGLSAVDRVSVSISDEGGNLAPFVTAEASPATAAPGEEITFSADYGDLDGEVGSWGWTFPDGTRSQELTPKRSFAEVGVQQVVFSATDDKGLTSSALVEVRIATPAEGALPPEVVSAPRTSIFAGQEYTYDKDGLPAVRGTGPFTFKLAEGPQGAQIAADTGSIQWKPEPGTEGEYPFTLEVSGQAGTTTQKWIVTVVSLGAPMVPVRGDGCGCVGATGSAGWMFAVPLVASLWARRRRRATARREEAQ